MPQDDDGRAAASRASRLRNQLQLTSDQSLQLVLLARALCHAKADDLIKAASGAAMTAEAPGLGAALGPGPLTPPAVSIRASALDDYYASFSGAPAGSDDGGGGKGSVVGGTVSSASWQRDANGNQGDVVDGLDSAAQGFLLAVRVAAAQGVLMPSAASGDARAEVEMEDGGSLAGACVTWIAYHQV